VNIHGTFDIPKCAIFREYSRNIGVYFGYFPWIFTEDWSKFSLFSVIIIIVCLNSCIMLKAVPDFRPENVWQRRNTGTVWG